MFGGSFSILHWIVVLAVVLLLFGGRGKVSAIMGDFGKGLRNFKTGLKGPEVEESLDDSLVAEAVQVGKSPAEKKASVKKEGAVKKTPTSKKKPSAKKALAKKKASGKKSSATK
jgi:sec-independent protein translocase protein TatA